MQRPDDTRQESSAFDALAAQFEAFLATPSDGELFEELRRTLRERGDAVRLAQVCAARARHLGGEAGASLLVEAAAAARIAGQLTIAEDNLRAAIRVAPAHRTASSALVELLLGQQRFGHAATALELELVALAEQSLRGERVDLAYQSARHSLLAKIYVEALGRLDRALAHLRDAWRLDLGNTEAKQLARACYRQLGEYKALIELVEAELASLTDKDHSATRIGLLVELAGAHDLAGEPVRAVTHYEQALSLGGASDVREPLANLYASTRFAAVSQQTLELTNKRASDLFVDLGKRAHTAGDLDRAISCFRRGLGLVPFDAALAKLLTEALKAKGDLDELDRFLVQQLETAELASERAQLISQRLAVAEADPARKGNIVDLLLSLVAADPSAPLPRLRLGELLRADKRFRELAVLMEQEAAAKPPAAQVPLLLELSQLYKQELADAERAAECIHRVLSIEPAHPQALEHYAEHFRDRRDWRGLVDLCEFMLENARDNGAPRDEILGRLEEIAQLAEVRLGDINRALETWRKISDLHPDSGKAKEAQRRLTSRVQMWQSVVTVLEEEARAATSPAQRIDVLRRIAQTYRERQIEPRRTIAIYEEIVGLRGDDDLALRALAELYERDGDDLGLGQTLRRQLEVDFGKTTAELAQAGASTMPKQWPVAKRTERVAMLRRLAALCDARLRDTDGVVYACTHILDLLPGDRDAMERMERALEQAGDAARLEKALEYHATTSTAAAEKSKVWRRLAKLAAQGKRADVALERWEQLLKINPTDLEALEASMALYEQTERWADLAATLERLDNLRLNAGSAGTQAGAAPRPLATPPAGAAAPAAAAIARLRDVERFARIVDERLGDQTRGYRAWQRVLDLAPQHLVALQRLAAIDRELGRHRELAATLQTLANAYGREAPQRALEASLERADLLTGKHGNPAEAEATLHTLLTQYDPRHVPALAKLRGLLQARGDVAGAVQLGHRQVWLLQDAAEKAATARDVAALCTDPLGDLERAMASYLWSLELEPADAGALSAATDVARRMGDFRATCQLLERRIEQQEHARRRRELAIELATVCFDKLADATTGFAWLRRAHREDPDLASLELLRHGANRFGLWEEYVAVLGEELERVRGLGDIAAQTQRFGELANVYEQKLQEPMAALTTWAKCLEAVPQHGAALREAERVAEAMGDATAWRRLLEIYTAHEVHLGSTQRAVLHTRAAQVYEHKLANLSRAVDEWIEAFAWNAEHPGTVEEVYRLAPLAKRWPDVVMVERTRADLAKPGRERGEALDRQAAVVEQHLGQPARAFRIHLAAAAEDPTSTARHQTLWRLAEQLGTFATADQIATTEPPGIGLHAASSATRRPSLPPLPRAAASAQPPAGGAPSATPAGAPNRYARAESTQVLTTEDLMSQHSLQALRDDVTALPRRRGQTLELSLDDVQEAPARPAASSMPPPAPARKPPPPRPTPVVRPQQAQPSILQTDAPARRYVTAWEELANAYERIGRRLNDVVPWMLRATEVWELGAKSPTSAFATLAAAVTHLVAQGERTSETRNKLHELGLRHELLGELAAFYEKQAEAAQSTDAVIDWTLELAAISERATKRVDAERCYRKILGIDPTNTTARNALEAMYRGQLRWVELAASLEERTDPRFGVAIPSGVRREALRELADIYMERLSRPHDAIDTLERLRELEPADTNIVTTLADLYTTLGRWSKVVEMHQRLADLGEGTSARRSQLIVAGVFERELELNDRAIETYEHILASWPADETANKELIRLYEDKGMWRKLADLLAAALERTPPAERTKRRQLLLRRASVEQGELRDVTAAAASWRQLIEEGHDEIRHHVALARAYDAGGRSAEAIAVFENLVASPMVAQEPAEEQVSLLLELARLHKQTHAPDTGRIADILAQARQLSPNDPRPLAALASITSEDDAPAVFAEAKLREAELAVGQDRVMAFVAAARTLSRLGEHERVRRVFARLLPELHAPAEQATARGAYAELLLGAGDLEAAIATLVPLAQDARRTADERAATHCQIAAIIAPHDNARAVEELRAAVALAPTSGEAIMALADALSTSLAHAEALVEFLEQTLQHEQHIDPEVVGEVYRYLAKAYEGLQRDDDAYQTLLEAERRFRGDILVKLALGENRFRAKRWREAAIFLSALGEHADAPMYPHDVARGLCHAALAEVKSLRADRAESLYLRALELDPTSELALVAMSERSLERGDVTGAVAYLEALTSVAQTSDDRAAACEKLGDLLAEKLGDTHRAAAAYRSAMAAIGDLLPSHVPLVRKLISIAGADRNSELLAIGYHELAHLADSDDERWGATAEAAKAYFAAGQTQLASQLARAAADGAPTAPDIVATAAEVAFAEGDVEYVAAVLGRLLSQKQLAADNRPMFAPLWRSLGAARAARGDHRQAAAAFERALEINATGAEATTSRRGLAGILGAIERTPAEDLRLREQLRILAAAGDPNDLIAFANHLAKSAQASDLQLMRDVVVAASERGAGLEALASFGKIEPASMGDDASYRGVVGAHYQALIADADDDLLGDVFAALAEVAPLLWPDFNQALERQQMSAFRLNANYRSPAVAALPALVSALGVKPLLAYGTEDPNIIIQVSCAGTPLVIFGPQLLGGAVDAAQARFWTARAVEFTRIHRIVGRGLPKSDVVDLLHSAHRLFSKHATKATTDHERALDDLLHGTLPIRLRQRLEQLMATLRHEDLSLERHWAATNRAADRAALLLSPDVRTALRVASALSSDISHLTALIAHPLWRPVREELLP